MSAAPRAGGVPQKSKSPLAGGQFANQKIQRKFSAMSTATEAQRDRILLALRLRPHTSYELRCLGIYQAPARIKELRDKCGHVITTDPVTLIDHDGYSHARCALYSLIENAEVAA